MAAQKLDADGVEGAKPGHALDGAADQNADTFLHLAGRLVGEGHGKDLAGISTAGCENMGDAGRQNAGLAGAGARKDKNGSVKRFHGVALFRVEAGKIIGRGTRLIARSHRAGGNAEPAGAFRACIIRRPARRHGFFIEERHIVETVAHAAQCSDSGYKGQNRVLLLFRYHRSKRLFQGIFCIMPACRHQKRHPPGLAAPPQAGWSWRQAR
ncbi:hypothetical protein D3C71_1240800 [compost metagenome]